ncbi:MAG: hypothetical protein SFX18_08835 [Pirellulales bacterium]|nr:hypothetical protein [Pirellulales bacterium]
MRKVSAITTRRTSLQRDFAAQVKQLQQISQLDLNLPLGNWVLWPERNMLRPLLQRSLNDILHSSVEELLAIPSLGPKKLTILMGVLRRIASDQGQVLPRSLAPRKAASGARSRSGRGGAAGGFVDWQKVSDMQWQAWGERVMASGLADEPVVHVVPQLNQIPTVIWTTPLAEYCQVSLTELSQLRTHGHKRISSISVAIQAAEQMLTLAQQNGKKLTRFRLPEFLKLEEWAEREERRGKKPTHEWITMHLLEPLLDQLALDVPPLTHSILCERIGWKCAATPVVQIATRLGMTRARVYQHFEMIAKVLKLRWPEGKAIWRHWQERLGEDEHESGKNGKAKTKAAINSSVKECYDLASVIFYPPDED